MMLKYLTFQIFEILNKPLLHNTLTLAQCNIRLLLLQIHGKLRLYNLQTDLIMY